MGLGNEFVPVLVFPLNADWTEPPSPVLGTVASGLEAQRQTGIDTGVPGQDIIMTSPTTVL